MYKYICVHFIILSHSLMFLVFYISILIHFQFVLHVMKYIIFNFFNCLVYFPKLFYMLILNRFNFEFIYHRLHSQIYLGDF